MNSANEQLIRTHHPSLRHLPTVYASPESDEKWIWVVAPIPTIAKISTHAAGREIHFLPGGIVKQLFTIVPSACEKFQPDPIHPLNPRRFLSQDNLCRLRRMFSSAIGARVLFSGFIVILFKSRKDVENSWLEDGFAAEFGNLRLRYDVLENVPTQKVLQKGQAITHNPHSWNYASLGLKIRFPDGEEAITVPTHTFVDLRTINSSFKLRAVDWFGKIKKKLARFAPVKRSASEPGILSPNQPGGNSPVGKEVFLASNSQRASLLSFMNYVIWTDLLWASGRSVPLHAHSTDSDQALPNSLAIFNMTYPWSSEALSTLFRELYRPITLHK